MVETKRYYRYIVYSDGRVFSEITNKFLKGDITIHGYLSYTLSINKMPIRIPAHRLVAMLFLERPDKTKYPCVNHKDGNKLNNDVSNLEWCSYYDNNKHARDTGLNNVSKSNHDRWQNEEFRKKTSKKFSEVHLAGGYSKGRNNGRFRYEIKDDKGNEYDRHSLSQLLNLSQSFTDSLIRRAANGEQIKQFIDHGIMVTDIKQSQTTIESLDNEKDVINGSE